MLFLCSFEDRVEGEDLIVNFVHHIGRLSLTVCQTIKLLIVKVLILASQRADVAYYTSRRCEANMMSLRANLKSWFNKPQIFD